MRKDWPVNRTDADHRFRTDADQKTGIHRNRDRHPGFVLLRKVQQAEQVRQEGFH